MTILCVSKQHFNFTFLCPSECQPDMFFFNKGTQVLVDKCYNRQCKSLCTCISLFGIIGICLVLLTETIYIFLSEKYKEIAFSGWAATILYCFICCQIYQMLNAHIFSISPLRLAHNDKQKMQKILAALSVNHWSPWLLCSCYGGCHNPLI